MHVKYFLVKTLRAFITTFLLVVFVFFVLRITGDPAQAMLPDDATEEDYIEFRQMWGLDKPLMEQFFVYCKNFIHGDFGQSYKDGRDVFEVISQRLPKSVWLMGMSIIFSIVVGLPLGIYAALHRNSFGDRFVMGAAVFGFSMPNFFLGIMFILIFSMKLHWLPSAGSDTWLHLLLPMITIGMTRMGSYARYTRSAMLNVLSKPYIITAKAKGVSRHPYCDRHWYQYRTYGRWKCSNRERIRLAWSRAASGFIRCSPGPSCSAGNRYSHGLGNGSCKPSCRLYLRTS